VASSQAFSRAAVRRVNGGPLDDHFDDLLAVEEPLEIRLGFRENGKLTHRAISITMRTPGDDRSLAAGFLFTEGIVIDRDHIAAIRHCNPATASSAGRSTLPDGRVSARIATSFPPSDNTIRVDLADGVELDLKRLERHFYTSSSCGVCGKSSIDALKTGARPLLNSTFAVSREVIHSLPNALRCSQDIFDQTGGLHASALFDAQGNIDIIREDVGRHNALDKVIGEKFLAGDVPLGERILMVSGRASFELVQKALMAGIPMLAAVGAPSSLAVELARETGMTLIGFVRDHRFNIYCGGERVKGSNTTGKGCAY
jgi:FdhD protein